MSIHSLLRPLLLASTRIYYKNIEVLGRENIPEQGPAILVANHPNSIADALLITTQLSDRKINFIAKDAIANIPILGPLLRAFGVVGVARGIDYAGAIRGTREKNLEAIDSCTPRLESGEMVTIFGEGISTDRRKLGIIKKGAMRIAYQAEAKHNFHLGISVIPVGINYSRKEKFRSDVFIEVGEPFTLSDLSTHPGENEAKILHLGTKRLQREIENLVVNLAQEELGPLLDDLSELYGRTDLEYLILSNSLVVKFARTKKIGECLNYFNETEPQLISDLEKDLREYKTMLRRLHLEDEVVAQKYGPGLFFKILGQLSSGLLGLGLNAYGWLNSFVPRYLGKLFRTLGKEKMIATTPAGVSVERIVVARATSRAHLGAAIGVLLFYPIQAALLAVSLGAAVEPIGALSLTALYVASLYPTWRFSLQHTEKISKHISDLRRCVESFSHRLTITKLRRRRNHLLRKLARLIDAFESLTPERYRSKV